MRLVRALVGGTARCGRLRDDDTVELLDHDDPLGAIRGDGEPVRTAPLDELELLPPIVATRLLRHVRGDEPEPEEVFCPVISVDDHVLEPPTIFEGRLPAGMAERAAAFGGTLRAGPRATGGWQVLATLRDCRAPSPA